MGSCYLTIRFIAALRPSDIADNQLFTCFYDLMPRMSVSIFSRVYSGFRLAPPFHSNQNTPAAISTSPRLNAYLQGIQSGINKQSERNPKCIVSLLSTIFLLHPNRLPTNMDPGPAPGYNAAAVATVIGIRPPFAMITNRLADNPNPATHNS